MPAFNIVAPDGRKFRLTAPDGVTQDQLLEKARAAKAMIAGSTAAPAPASAPAQPEAQAPPAVQSITSTTTSDTPPAQPEGGGLGVGTPEEPGLIGTAMYRGLFRPAQLFASAMPGATQESLEARKAAKIAAGAPGAAMLPTEPSTGVLGVAGSLLSPLEAAAPVLWGAGTATQYVTGDEHIADLVEGALSLPAIVRSGVRVGRAGYRFFTALTEGKTLAEARRATAGGLKIPTVDGVSRPEHAGKTAAEVKYLDQRDVTIPAAERTADYAYRAQAAAEGEAVAAKQAHELELDVASRHVASANRVRDAAKAAEDAQAAHHIAAQNRLGTVREQYAAAKAADASQPSNVVRRMAGLPTDSPSAKTAGEILTAAGEERTTLAPGAEPVGVATARFKTADRTREAYATANKIADAQGVTLPLNSSSATEMLDAAREWAERVGKYASPIERDAVGEILTSISQGDIPYSALNDLHARLSTIALSPRDYAATAGAGKKELTRFKYAVQTALRTLEVTTPDLADAAKVARDSAREGEKVRQTAKALIGQTPETAFATMVNNPTHLRRVMTYAGQAEQDTYRMAFWHDAIERATDAVGNTSPKKLLEIWDTLPAESRGILASGATAEARTGMLELAAGRARTPKIKADIAVANSITRNALKELEKLHQQWAKAAKAAGVPAEKYASVVQARKDFVAAEKEAAARFGDAARYREALELEQKTFRELGGKTPGGHAPPDHAKSLLLYHGFQALRGVFGGGIGFGSLTHGGLAFALSRHPRLVRDTVALPVASSQWDMAAAGLGAALRGWRGFVENPEQAEQEAQQ